MKKVALWILAVVITLSAVIYQRMTGPTYPKRVKIELDGIEYNLKLLRSHGGTTDAPIELNIDPALKAVLHFKYFPNLENEEWKTLDFEQIDGKLVANLPNQPPAGKLMYYVDISTATSTVSISKEEPVVIRYKGDVPASILVPHIFLMFFSMMLANVAGLFAIAGIERFKTYTNLTFIFLLLGGMILGPLVQLNAFGDLWTGVPFGWDLTDNKTLIAFLFWLAAVIGNRRQQRPWLTIIAAIVGLLVYSIPHSMFGSELDRASGQVTQGMIQLFYLF